MRIRPLAVSEAQQRFRQSSAWMRGFVGGRGAGKSKIGSIDIALRAKPGEPWMGVSPDMNVARETSLLTFLETVQYTGQYISHTVSPDLRVYFQSVHGTGKPCNIIFKGAEKPDKLRGPNKAGLWFDEASIISEEAFQLGLATNRYRGRMGPVICTFTPRGFRHWSFEKFYTRIADTELESDVPSLEWFNGRAYKAALNTELVRCASRDNPFLPAEYVTRIGQNYSSNLALQELEGDFIDMAGFLFRREWLAGLVDDAPAIATRVRYWDKAASPDTGCYTVGLLMARDPIGVYYIEDVVRGQWSPHERDKVMLATAKNDARKYNGTVLTYIEQEGGGDGKAISDQLITKLSEFPVYRDVVSGGRWKMQGGIRLPHEAKVRRALPLAAQAEAGNVRLINSAWNNDYVDEMIMFPEYAFADQVDASSGAFNALQRIANDYGQLHAEKSVVDGEGSQRFGALANNQQESTVSWGELPWNQNINNTDEQTM